MNIAAFALKNQRLMIAAAFLIIVFGILSFFSLGRLENPEYTIKTALIITPYPGASPLEAEEEVTEVIERAVQALGEIKEIRSWSQAGVSYVFVDIKDRFTVRELPQIWDKLRKRVGETAGRLPPGAGPPRIIDDFGDEYGVFFALHGEGYSYAQLKEYADSLKKELLLCEDVAQIALWGEQPERIYLEIQRARLAELGIPPERIQQAIGLQNQVDESGAVNAGGRYIRILPTGELTDEHALADLFIPSASGTLIRLGDLATVKRGYPDPPRNLLRYNGNPAIGIGISTIPGGNVVAMGQAVEQKIEQLAAARPAGMTLDIIYYQSRVVTEALDTFTTNLAQAVGIVIGILLLFMGWRSGLIIGGILLLTILGTFIGMALFGIFLQKISLGALILALGMLVDNAIVIADGILVRLIKGDERKEAAMTVVRENAWPLLGATMVAILAFAAIGLAPGGTGEFCRSLFQVLSISLTFSWVTAVTLTPLFCVWFLKKPASATTPFQALPYRLYRKSLNFCLRFRVLTLTVIFLLLCTSFAGFSRIPNIFFPPTTQKYFYINLWNPQGTHIDQTSADMETIARHVSALPGVVNVAEFIGEGTLRFVLNYQYQRPNSAYGQLLVEIEDYRQTGKLIDTIEHWLTREFPDAAPYCERIMNGPPVEFLIEARFRGPESSVLLDLAAAAENIMEETGGLRDIRTDWRQPVQLIRPQFSETQARQAGLFRSDLSRALQMNFTGIPVGLYREGNDLLPIVVRPPEEERGSVDNLMSVQLWNSTRQSFSPISLAVSGVQQQWENPIIRRQDQQRAITVQCNPQAGGFAEPMRRLLIEKFKAVELPPGYTMSWQGEFRQSMDGQKPLQKIFPLCLLGMFFILIALFNSIRKPLIIFLTLPLQVIGITAGLLVFASPFGFMAILGFLGLSGMLIKNAIVLIEQIDLLIEEGAAPYQAILDASIRRLRPVTMASGTTIFGMIPLITEPMFSSMAVTMMGGLFAATFLTLIVVPLLYRIVYRISEKTPGSIPENSSQ